MSLFNLFQKRAPERKESDEPPAPFFVLSGQPVRFLSNAALVTAETAFRKSPQLYRIANFIASQIQSVPWFCEQDQDTKNYERAGAAQIKDLNALLKSPNDSFTPPQLRYWLGLNLMLYARAHYKVGVSSTGTPNGLYPLAAKHVKGVLNTRGGIDAYDYGEGDQKVSIPTRRTAERRAKNEAYAAEISFPSLSGLVEYSKTPAAIEAISYPIAIVYALMQRALDTASGHPNVRYVITAERTLTKQQRDALVSHLDKAGPGEADSGQVLFLYNTEIKVHTLDNKLDDIHSKLPLDDMTRQIAGVFGVPIALLGLGSADAAKYASNYEQSRLSFYQDTLIPSYLIPIAAGLTQALCPPGAKISFDLDAVPALWQGRAMLGQTLSLVTCLTPNERRGILDFEPLPDPAADQLAPVAAPLNTPQADPDAEIPKPETTKDAQIVPLPRKA